MKRMDVCTVAAVSGGPSASLVVLRTRETDDSAARQLPIRIGGIEAESIAMGISDQPLPRPLTHDLMLSTVDALGGRLDGVEISDVEGTTFFAKLLLTDAYGVHREVDARPSDALALAVRRHVPIYASEQVIGAASMPNFSGVEDAEKEQELRDFHDFVETLSPEDFGGEK